MDAWVWGLRHTVVFESIVAPYVGDLGALELLLDQFAITTEVLPLTDGPLEPGDPRRSLLSFPRPGDNLSVDRADPGFRGNRFEYRDGPVMRMVIALYPDGRVWGQDIMPGGQSGLVDSPHFADQAALWLGNQTLPLRFHLEEVVAGATGREVYSPP
jgi:acyl-homoserine lactone acylase PvdQ